MKCAAIAVNTEITIYHTGPALDHGPLPAFFYFSLSGADSLTLDPYNQPVQFLDGQMIRIFSMTLPGHETGLAANQAMGIWAEEFTKGNNCLEPFLDQAMEAIEFAINERFINPHKMAIGGLSRGAFAAAHLAAREKRFSHILGFAPLTKLGTIKEFHSLKNHPRVEGMDLIHLTPDLQNRQVKLFVGNRDIRVGTENCFEFALALPNCEFTMSKSIGNMGHGTSPETFEIGARWIESALA